MTTHTGSRKEPSTYVPEAADPHALTEQGRKHGRVISWIFVSVVIVDFAVGGAALILAWWLVFFVCAGIFALAPLMGAAIGIMQDTVQWALPPPRHPEQRDYIDDLHRPQ